MYRYVKLYNSEVSKTASIWKKTVRNKPEFKITKKWSWQLFLMIFETGLIYNPVGARICKIIEKTWWSVIPKWILIAYLKSRWKTT